MIGKALEGYGLKPKAIIDQVPWDLPGIGEIVLFQQTLVGNREELIAPEFLSFAQLAFKANPIIFSCVVNRMFLFKQARFQFRERNQGRPGRVFGNTNLVPLEQPWQGATTTDLLAIAEVHNSLSGNFFATRRGDEIKVMRPDWTAMIIGTNADPDVDDVGVWGLDAEVLGYVYWQGGRGGGHDPIVLFPEDVAHYMPIPDPEAPWRGVSWISSVIRDLMADKQSTSHKQKFLEAGATPNLAIKLDVENVKEFDEWVNKFRETREGERGNPYQTLFLAAAATPIPLGQGFKDIDFTSVQGAGEVRIATAAMVPPAILSISEGLKGSALNAGNLQETWRQFADNWARPSWQDFAGSMQRIVTVPASAELWCDDRDIPALQEDAKKLAETIVQQAQAIRTLTDGGFEPQTVVDGVTRNDLASLKHTGLLPVQVQPPGSNGATNGAGALHEETVST